MNGARGIFLAVGAATAQRVQAGLPEALKTQDGCEPQDDSSPESTSTSDIPTPGSGPQSLHRWPWLASTTPSEAQGGEREEKGRGGV